MTVDAEAGYGMEPAELVAALRTAGAAGCNLEDTDHAAASSAIPTGTRSGSQPFARRRRTRAIGS